MAENNRNQDHNPGSSRQENQNYSGNESRNASDEQGQDPNPQQGSQWSNYRTRELSDEGKEEGSTKTPRGE